MSAFTQAQSGETALLNGSESLRALLVRAPFLLPTPVLLPSKVALRISWTSLAFATALCTEAQAGLLVSGLSESVWEGLALILCAGLAATLFLLWSKAREAARLRATCAERLAAAEALRAERDLLVEGPVAVLVCLPEPGWPVERASSNIQRILGFSVEDLVEGRLTLGALMLPEGLEASRELVTEKTAAGEPHFERELQLRDPSGRFRWLHARIAPQRDTSGAVTRFTFYLSDANERMLATLEQRRARERLELALDAAELGVWDWSVASGRLRVNARCAGLHGLPESETELRVSDWERRMHPEDLVPVGEVIAAHFMGKSAMFEAEARVLSKDERWRWIVSRGRLVERDEQGGPTRALGVVLDETERKEALLALLATRREDETRIAAESKRAEEARDALALIEAENKRLEERMALAEAASRAKGDFLANMSHEIRSPLNAIVGFANLAQKTGIDPRMASYLSKINAASHTLLGLVNDILDFSKIEAQKVELERVEFSLPELTQRLADMFSFALAEKGLAFAIELDEKAPRHLRGDPLRLEQILINLAQNAIKFTEKGGLELRVAVLEKNSERVRLSFTVTDTGVGISPDVLPFLFEPFTQADLSTTRRFGGAGLGLAISRRLVELMGGELSVTSQPGKGSAFTFVLNMERAPAGYLGPSTRRLIETPLPSINMDSGAAPTLKRLPQVPSYAGLRVLVVEDNPINQQVAKETLEVGHITVDLASNGEEALAAAHANKYDLVFMDIQMPGMDGRETTRLLRSQSSFEKLPVIAMTAHVTTEDRDACLAAGMNDFIAKPFDFETIFNVVARWAPASKVMVAPEVESLSDAVSSLAQRYAAMGLFVLDGTRRAAGKFSLYIKLLGDFVENHAQDAARIAAARDRGDKTALLAILHKLKSVSGVIGSRRLHELVVSMEAAVKNDAPERSALESEFDASFRQALQAALGFLADMREATMSAAATASPQPVAFNRFSRTLAAFRTLLLEGNMRAMDCLDELKVVAPAAIPAYLIAGVESHLRRFDMEAAVPLVDEIGRILEASHENVGD